MPDPWLQTTWPGAIGTSLSTITPDTGGSYGAVGNIVTDGSGNLYRNIATSEDNAQLVGFAEPASRITVYSFDVWEEAAATHAAQIIIFGDASNYLRVRAANVDGGATFAVDVYQTLGGTLSLLGAATATGITPSTTQAAATVRIRATHDRTNTAAPTLKVEMSINGAAYSTLYTLNPPAACVPNAAYLGLFGGDGSGSLRIGPNLHITDGASAPGSLTGVGIPAAETRAAGTLAGGTSTPSGTVFWKQATFAGASGASLITITPTNPPGGSYTLLEGTAIVDGVGNVMRNTDAAGAEVVTLAGWTPPTSKKFTMTCDLWDFQFSGSATSIDFRFGTDASNFYWIRTLLNNATSYITDVWKNLAGSLASIHAGVATNTVASNTQSAATVNIQIDVDQSTAGTTVITVFTGVNGGAKTQLFTLTDTSSIGMAAAWMILFGGSTSGPMRFTNLSIGDGSATGFSVSQDLGDMVVTGALSATCQAPTPVGGSGTNTFQFYRATTPNFTLASGTLLSGANAQTYNRSDHVAGTQYYIACRISDGVSTVDTNRRMFMLSGLPPLVLGFIGDSTFGVSDGFYPCPTDNAPYYCGLFLQTMLGLRAVTILNAAIPGTSSQEWIPGSVNLNNALALFTGAAPPTHVVVDLGVNDAQAARAASSVASNVASTLALLTADGYKCLVSLPGPRNSGDDFESPGIPFTDDYYTSLDSYVPVLKALVNNTTIFPGDYLTYYCLAAKSAELGHSSNIAPGGLAIPTPGHTGWVHWRHQGCAMSGMNTARALMAVISPVTAGRPSRPPCRRGRT